VQEIHIIEKLLDNKTAILILHLLSKKPLLLSQIIEALHDIESRSVVAVLGELHRFKLVKQINRNFIELEQKSPEKMNSTPNLNLKNNLEINRITLGLPLSDYISFWEDLSQDKHQEIVDEYNRYYFTLPQYLKEKIANCNLKEIRAKILGSNF
jgi:hypothetical protein